MQRKAALFALTSLAPLIAWHLGAWRRGASYLLLDLTVSMRWIALLHLGAIALGALFMTRGRRLPPWRLGETLAVFGFVLGASQLAMFFAFGSARAFVVVAPIAAIFTGFSLGALATTAFRILRGLGSSAEGMLVGLRPEILAVMLAAAVIAIALIDRAGPLRASLGASLAVSLTGYLAASTLAPSAPGSRRAAVLALALSLSLAGMITTVEPLAPWMETPRLPDPLVYARSTETSRVVLTSGRGAFQLYVDGLLRMSTIDAKRRREAMVLPVMSAAKKRARVLVIGGGDGGSLREILRLGDVERVTLVDPDEPLVAMARTQPVLLAGNDGALDSPRVTVAVADPLPWLRASGDRFDVIVLDLLDPEGPARSKLYTAYFHRLVVDHLDDHGIAVTTAPSPASSRQAFWCVVTTLESLGISVLPYRAGLPTVGEAGFVLFSRDALSPPASSPIQGDSIDDRGLSDLFALAPDESRVAAGANLLHRQLLVKYREQDMP